MTRLAHLISVEWVAQRRKFLVALIALAGQAVALGLVHGSALQAVTLALGVAGALGVHQVSNDPAPADTPPADGGHTQLDTALLIAALFGVLLLLFKVYRI